MVFTHQLNGITTVRCSVGHTTLSSHSHRRRLHLVVPQVVRKCITSITVPTLAQTVVHLVPRINSLSPLEEIGCKQARAQTPRVPCLLK